MLSTDKELLDYVDNQRYVKDDAKMLFEFLDKEWSVPEEICPKPVFYYDMTTDVDSFNFTDADGTYAVRVVIYADDIESIPLGIGFDGYTHTRIMAIRIDSLIRLQVIIVSDEIDRILARHGVRPGNDWHLLYKANDIPVNKGRKYYRRMVAYELKSLWRSRMR